MKFRRETATHEADLPHEFELDEQPTVAKLCVVCAKTPRDPRHLAWESQQLRERADSAESFNRELGS